MKRLKLKSIALACLLPSLFYGQDWNNANGTPTPDIYRGGKIGSGTWYMSGNSWGWYYPESGPQIEAANADVLGTNVGDHVLISSFSSDCGTAGNWIRNNQWSLRNSNGTAGWSSVNFHDGISIDDQFHTPGTNTLTWWERNPYNDIQKWGNVNQTYMSLTKGRLAINWTGSNARLDLNETDNSFATLIARSNHTTDNTRCIYASVARDRTMAFSVGNNNYNNGGALAQTFVVYGDGTTRIGVQTVTSRASSLLQVSGEIDCKSLYVLKPATWQDRVFEKSYTLPALSEVENYISANKHLPGIKSEKEVLENGYDVNEIDAALLEKIENLYLYVIKQQKEIDALKNKLGEK